jgi:hypothetical protein
MRDRKVADAEPPFDVRRYDGRPLLRLLDCYVLALTGSLDPEMETKVATIVRRQFGRGADWKTTLRRRIKLPDDLDEQIRTAWRAQPAGTDPLDFTLRVSDGTFVPMITPIIDPA